jgi:hypothetical protein
MANQQQQERQGLLNPHVMDGPTIPFTVADIVYNTSSPAASVTYHVVSNGFVSFTAFGNVLGVAAYGMGMRKYPLLVTMGTASLGFGAFGSFFGYMGLHFAKQANNPDFPPWDTEGTEMRANGMHHNFRVRLLDAGAWSGIGAAAGTLLLTGWSPARLGYSAGKLGIAQVLSQGCAIGSTLAMVGIYLDKQKQKREEKELDLEE